MVSFVKLRRTFYITSVTGAVGTSLCVSVILRKVHKDALEYVNAQRLIDGRTPINDFPPGIRFDERLSPIGKVIDMRRVDQALSEDEVDSVAKTIIGGTAESVVAWYTLFCIGLYPKYIDPRFYAQLPPSRLRRLLSAMKNKPSDWQESYLRTKALIDHIRHELPIRT